jgi:hypothetical protein
MPEKERSPLTPEEDSPKGTQRQTREAQQQQPVRDDLDTEIRKIREEFRTHFTKCEDLIKRLGNAIKKAGIVKQNDICHEIKMVLAAEITDQNITVRTIDRCCPDEWKRITKPKKDKMSFSKPPQQIALTPDGNQILQDGIDPPPSDKEQQHTVPQGQQEEKPAIDSEPANKQDIEEPASVTVKQESVAAKSPQPQESKPEPHEIILLLLWNSLSEQMSQAHFPGIEWVKLSGTLDEKSRLVNNLKLTRAESPCSNHTNWTSRRK